MNCKLENLFSYLIERNLSAKSSFHRSKYLLKTKCHPRFFYGFEMNQEVVSLFELLARYAPLVKEDLGDHKSAKYWDLIEAFPQDRSFFNTQIKLFNKLSMFNNKNIEDFIFSADGKEWFGNRKKIKRRPLFEIDCYYPLSKQSALAYEQKVKRLLRLYPALNLADMRQLNIKNAQSIWQRFPQRELYRKGYLEKVFQKWNGL